ncbi:MAG: PIG-L family deacetylase [Chloroflexota bacterium]|jgi:LmbE family N-acetylglucosaminyl deacetylase|nr:PIG-L family deacetylase [Chloroflexota bacterium]
MAALYDWLYLSPHLDDVALSCGGQIAQHVQSGQTVLIVSVMAGDPPEESVSGYAQSLHDRWLLATDAAAGRRQEDLEACRILGADALHWDVPDCIYRTHPQSGEPFYVSDDDIFGAIAPAEMELLDTLVSRMQTLPAHRRIAVPLTVGNHVDHQLVRLAAERCFGTAALDYYEDYPYAQDDGAVAATIAAQAGVWRAEVTPLCAAALETKIAAIRAYHSQLSTFFADDADLREQVTRFAETVGGERLWRRLS